MAEIHVEREGPEGPDDYAPRKRRWGAWLLLPVALMALAVPFLFTNSLQQATVPSTIPPAGLDYRGQRWAPSGSTLSVPDADMVRVGASRDGRPLYVVKDPDRRGLGGGGGAGDALPTGLVYVRVGEGAYQPLVRR